MSLNTKLNIFIPDDAFSEGQQFISSGIKAGFPSPAADFEENKISLDKTLVKNAEATFYAKASGNSMTGAGIDDGDILVIDRSLEPTNNKIAVCLIDGEIGCIGSRSCNFDFFKDSSLVLECEIGRAHV